MSRELGCCHIEGLALDGGHPARSLHLFILRKGTDSKGIQDVALNFFLLSGQRQADPCWDLEMQVLQEDDGRRRVDPVHISSSHCEEV